MKGTKQSGRKAPIRGAWLVLLGLAATGCDLMLDALPDETAPRIRLLEPSDSLPTVTPDSSLVVKGTAVDDRVVDRVTVVTGGQERETTIAAGQAVSFQVQLQVPGLGDSVEVRAYDAAGNRGTARIRAPIFDRTPPTVTVTDPTGYPDWTDGTFRLAGTASDANGIDRVVAEYAYDGRRRSPLAVLPASFDSVVTIERAISTTVNVRVTAYDVVDNATYTVVQVNVDRVAPQLALPYAHPRTVADSAAFVTVEANDNGSGMAAVWAIGGGDTAVAVHSTFSWAVIGVPAAAGGMTVVGTDAVGNTDTASIAWLDTAFVALDGVDGHACMVTAGGAAHCVGRDDNGQLGDGIDDGTGDTPVPVAGGHTFKTIRAGPSTTCGIDGSGSAYCWGANGAGQLGDGTLTDRPAPVLVAGGHTFTEIHPAERSTCALDHTGTAFCWGRLPAGGGTWETVPAPRAVTAPASLTAIRLDPYGEHVCALDAAGAAYCWGLSMGYDTTATANQWDTVAVKVGDGPYAVVQPLGTVGSWAESTPWTFVVTEAGAVKALGGDTSTRWIVDGYETGPFDAVIVDEGGACAVKEAEVWCASWLGPAVAVSDAGRLGLQAATLTAVPCFLTPAGSLYCRDLDD